MAIKKQGRTLSIDMERCIVLLSKNKVCVCVEKVCKAIYQVFNSDYIWGKGQRF